MSAVCGDPPCSAPRKESDEKKKVSEGKEGEEFARFAHIRHRSFIFETFWTFFYMHGKIEARTRAEGDYYRFKGTVRPDWICMRVVPLESPLKGHQLLYVLIF